MIKDRPFFITVMCIYLLATASFHLVMSFFYLGKPETLALMHDIPAPYIVQVVMLYLNNIILIIAAIYIMEEANWARWLYLGWGFVNIDYNLYIQKDWHNDVIGIATYLVFAVVLLVPSANEYFSSDFDYEAR